MNHLNFKKIALPNGVRALVVPMPGNPTVTVAVGVCTGSYYESAEESGISHFLEHMCFKGTAKRPTPRAISTELDSIGAVYNAFTSSETTGYWAKADTRHFAKIADVVADIFKNSTLPESEIEKEKGVVVGEIDMYADDPQTKLGQALDKHVYGGQPAERDVLGTKETVRSVTRDALFAYRASQYTGPNTIVVVAGGVTEEDAFSWAKATFSDIPSTPGRPQLPTLDRVQTGAETVFIDKDTDQSHIVVAWRSLPRSSPDRYILSMIRSVLRSGMSSRLFLRLREDMGAGYYVGAASANFDSFGVFAVTTGTAHERVAEVVSAILAEIERLKTEPVGAEELNKVKEYVRAHRLMSLETSDDMAHYVGDIEAVMGKVITPEEYEAIYAAIQPADIVRVANSVFTKDKLTVAAIGKGIDKESVIKAIS